MTAPWGCPRCHAKADGWAAADGTHVEDLLAMDGAISVCLDCSQVAMLTPTGPRLLTPDEWADLHGPHREALHQIACLIISAQRRASIIAAGQQS